MSTTKTRPTSTSLTTWTIDPAHTQVEFEVKHMMFAKVRGHFRTVAGTVRLEDPDDFATARVEAAIESASVDTGQAARDEHLRSADFFDAPRFPELEFVSRSVRREPDGRMTATGDLTIRGVTREVKLDVKELGQGLDPWGKQRVGFSATTTIDRRDFGLTWNQALEAGGILVGNDIRITLEVQAVRAA